MVRDTAADPQRAAAAVDDLARAGVVALAGEYHSVVARAVAARADAVGLPFLCSSAVLDALTDRPTDLVARLAPPQSRGWRLYADHLLDAGHRRVAVAAAPSVYWESGTRILRDHLASRGGAVVELAPTAVRAASSRAARRHCCSWSGTRSRRCRSSGPSAATGAPSEILIGAPAGQPEFAGWSSALGGDGAGIPFLRYLPERLGPLGARVRTALREHLAEAPSFVAFEGYDTIAVLAERLRVRDSWSQVAVDGTRGRIRFSRTPGSSVWQWASAADPGRRAGSGRSRSFPRPPEA